MMIKVFLGGTCNESTWREDLIKMFNSNVDYFNPVVDDWTPECQIKEKEERRKCDFVLYTITNEMTGVYSIAEVVDDSNKRPNKTIFCNLYDSTDESMLRSLKAVETLVDENGGKVFNSLQQVASYLNKKGDLSKCINARTVEDI